jgi:hypothetical protein
MCSGVLPDAAILNQLERQRTYTLANPWGGAAPATRLHSKSSAGLLDG